MESSKLFYVFPFQCKFSTILLAWCMDDAVGIYKYTYIHAMQVHMATCMNKSTNKDTTGIHCGYNDGIYNQLLYICSISWITHPISH